MFCQAEDSFCRYILASAVLMVADKNDLSEVFILTLREESHQVSMELKGVRNHELSILCNLDW